MGQIRARTDAEIAKKKKLIMRNAAKLLLGMDYGQITLAMIAEKSGITRTSMYTYYNTKEQIYVDLLISEYEALEKTLKKEFGGEPMSRSDFCRKLTYALLKRHVLVWLWSLQLSMLDQKYTDKALIEYFTQAIVPYTQTLDEVLRRQFPDAGDDALHMFGLQFTAYCISLRSLDHLPDAQKESMRDKKNRAMPSGDIICYQGLMLLTALLEKDAELYIDLNTQGGSQPEHK